MSMRPFQAGPFRVMFGLAAISCALWRPVEAQPLVTGDLVAQIQTIRNAMPDMGSNAFVLPADSALTTFGTLVTFMREGRTAEAEALLSPYGYSLVRFVQTATTDTFLLVRENIPVQRGWGTYILFPGSSLDLAVEVPHPIWDTRSWELGSRLFLRLRARWFFMAGTHRYANDDESSDMAHVTRSAFHRAHTTAAAFRAIQTHGFDKSKSMYAGYPDVVISNGTTGPPSDLYQLQSAYEAHGFTAGVFSVSTSSSLDQLGATTNKQGQWSNANDKRFVHIEHDYPLRTNFFQLLQVVESINAVYGTTTAIARGSSAPVEWRLEPNVPNPFNPSTRIGFRVQIRSAVTLSVYDLCGREVGRPVEGMLEAGEHSVTFNAAGLSSGVYLYRLQADQWTESRTMLLLK